MSTVSNDEIDLIEVLEILWDGKWIIGSVSAAALLIGSAYIVLTPNKFDASIVVRPLDAAETDRFQVINDAILNLTDGSSTTIDYISSNSLIADFTETLLQRETIVQAAQEHQLIADGSYPNEATYEAALRKFAFTLDIQPVDTPAPTRNDASNLTTAWQITWQANDSYISDAFIATALSLTNEAARDRLQQRLLAKLEQFQRINTRRASQLRQEIENKLQDYQFEVNDRLAYLSEQASLARVLGIEFGIEGRTENAYFAQGVGSGTVNISNIMTYLNGYQALEQQISILSSRENFEAFVPGLRGLQSELRSLEQDASIRELLAAVETSPLSNLSEFRAAQYDLASIEITRHKKKSLILAISLVLGGFVGVVTVLTRKALNARRDL